MPTSTVTFLISQLSQFLRPLATSTKRKLGRILRWVLFSLPLMNSSPLTRYVTSSIATGSHSNRYNRSNRCKHSSRYTSRSIRPCKRRSGRILKLGTSCFHLKTKTKSPWSTNLRHGHRSNEANIFRKLVQMLKF